MPASATVSVGDTARADDHNTLRTDALNLYMTEGSDLTISTGAVTKVNTASFYRLIPEGGSGDDVLSTINGGVAGDVIVIGLNAGTDTVQVAHMIGNISLRSQRDIVLFDTGQVLILWFDGTSWLEVDGGRLVVFGGTLGNGSNAIASGDLVDIPWLPGVYILGLYGVAKESGSVSIDVRRDNWGLIPDSADSIGTSPCFVMSAQQTKSDTTLSGITKEQGVGTWRFITTAVATTITQVSIVVVGVRV